MPLLLLLHLDCHCCCCCECCCCCCSVRKNQQHALLWIVLSNSLAESDRCQVLFVARRLQKMLCINLRRLQLTSKSMCLLDNDLQTQRPSVACSVDRLHLLTLVPSELRLVTQIVASDDNASKTLSQHFSFVERPTVRRTGSKAQPVATPANPAFAAAETRRSRSIVLFPQQQQQRKSCVASKDVQKWETSQVRNMRRRQYRAKYNARIAKIPTVSDASGKSNLPGRRLTF